jgi:hypothetical protein
LSFITLMNDITLATDLRFVVHHPYECKCQANNVQF